MVHVVFAAFTIYGGAMGTGYSTAAQPQTVPVKRLSLSFLSFVICRILMDTAHMTSNDVMHAYQNQVLLLTIRASIATS
jgi:hypothetical protein